MAVLHPRQIADPVHSLTNNHSDPTHQVYLSAILLATFSFILMLLIIPPMFWHLRNRNIGATVLVFWVVLLLFFTLVNALLWPADNIDSWYNGVGLCDVEVKIQVASQVAFPASLACVLRALAKVLDTDRVSLVQTKAQRSRYYAIDLSWCVGLPLLQMLLHYIVQTKRYYIYGIAGCVPAVSNSWPTIVLIVLPPALWTVIDAYFAVLILIRLYRYRLTFTTILAATNTPKSRFMRLYLICILWILGYIPVQSYVLYTNIDLLWKVPYSWSEVHDPKVWNEIIMVPSGGKVVYDRWIWLTCGVIVFVFFGFGREAVNMYRSGLIAMGAGKVFPSLRSDCDGLGSITSTVSSFGSRARMLLKRMSSGSETTTSSEPISPKKTTSLSTINSNTSIDEKTPSSDSHQPQGSHTTRANRKLSILSRMSSLFRPEESQLPAAPVPLPLTTLTEEQNSVHSAVMSGPRSPSLAQHMKETSADEVLVRKEVRQGSEHGEDLAAAIYHSR